MKKVLFLALLIVLGWILFRSSLILAAIPLGEMGTPPTDCKTLWWKDSAHATCSQKKFCGAYLYEGLEAFESQSECAGQISTAETPPPPLNPTPPQSWWEKISKNVLAFISRVFSVFEGRTLTTKTVQEGTLSITFRRGPIRPVCRLDQPCDAPAADFPFQVRLRDNAEILLSAKSDQNGRYQTQLESGPYILSYQPRQIEKLWPHGQDFTIIAGQTTNLNVAIDTGIR